MFDGIPQDGVALGDPDAPITLVEFADLQCPFCAEWAIEALPVYVEDYVRTGQMRIEFRPLTFIGNDSVSRRPRWRSPPGSRGRRGTRSS